MKNKNYQKQAAALFALLTIGSAFVNAYGMVASVGEQIIAFISALITYAVIVCLFLTYLNIDAISIKARTRIGVSFVIMTIVESVYPMVLYSDQTLPTDYYFVFFVQLILNTYIAKVISNERTS
ncbi:MULTISPECIES: hypothetical protein [unclassified Vibrio]|uniref:hypothetical protein n=1 Tax=unclassified Vibrio TaxID=2614977 RepID=UPI0012A98D75|nr:MULTISPECIES: hypothetical protein [unclassified Vibrio]QFT40079.1 hypothetical protein FIU99_27185 [Vibrio sp. THAF64]QGM38024.1 hypothetical protein GGC04_27390 [Vibrio sp. THAF191d]QGN73517.1 hypothetical protein GGC03_27390 [Vibrio sp. THAF191c]